MLPTNDKREWYRSVYLKSPHWAKLRAKKLAMKPMCELCGSSNKVEPHHKIYRNIFDVGTSDLISVCRPCHAAIHRQLDAEKRAQKKKPLSSARLNKIVMATIDLSSQQLFPVMENFAGIPVITPKMYQSKYASTAKLLEEYFGLPIRQLVGRGLTPEVIKKFGLNPTRYRGPKKTLSELGELARERIFGK